MVVYPSKVTAGKPLGLLHQPQKTLLKIFIVSIFHEHTHARIASIHAHNLARDELWRNRSIAASNLCETIPTIERPQSFFRLIAESQMKTSR